MTLESAAPANSIDANGYIAIDIPCRQCGYNVRGLPYTGRCPECGIPVAISVHGDLLRFSKPQWLLTLKRGVNLIITGVALMILGGVLGAAAKSELLSGLVFLIAAGCNLAGSWFLTAPDPSGLGEDKYGTARKIIRFSLLVGIVQQVANLVPDAVGPSYHLSVVVAIVAVVAGIISVVGQFALLSYLSNLAMRIPDYKLSERAKFLMYAIGTCYGVLVLGGVFAVLTGMAKAGPAIVAFACFMGIAGLALLVFGIMYLLMLEKLGKAFKAQAELSQQLWASLDAEAAS